MATYRVTVVFPIYGIVVEADSQDEAEDIACKLADSMLETSSIDPVVTEIINEDPDFHKSNPPSKFTR